MPAERELTLRSLLTGILLGALLTPSNIYSGLKIGWSFNMSIIALLLGFSFWRLRARHGEPWTLRESNISQTSASSAASIISGGLVAPIPAYTLISGQQIDTLPLIVWVFSVSLLGIWVAWYLRRPLILDSPLRFPAGMATLETMQDIFSHGGEAVKRIAMLSSAALLSGGLKWIDGFLWQLPRWAPTPLLERLTFTLDPSLLLVGFGGIIGLRVGLSLLLGALLAWGALAPWLLISGRIELPPGSSGPQFGLLVEWLLWPGVSLMVSATLASLLTRLLSRMRHGGMRLPDSLGPRPDVLPLLGLALSGGLVVTLQILLFDIAPLMAVLTLPLALVLASVAARVVGETAIPPIGALGKLSQLGFGLAAPGETTLNLMSANTAGGAAGQCADLLNDFKAGHAIGAEPKRQLVAQCFGILTGSIVGVLAYQALIPDPQGMLLTEEWPAPAVATWKAVAEALGHGLDSIPPSALWAMLVAVLAGSLMGICEGLDGAGRGRLLPSSAALGLAFMIPASLSLMMACGALLAWLLMARWRTLAERFVIAAAAGLIAGESLVGVGTSFWRMLG
ncbi:OPT/YSL family transporter [Azotobacter armeniacus]